MKSIVQEWEENIDIYQKEMQGEKAWSSNIF